MAQILDQVTAPLFAFLNVLEQRRSVVLTKVVNSHEPILNALRACDPRAAEIAIQEHVEGSYERILRWCASDNSCNQAGQHNGSNPSRPIETRKRKT
jgi:DNA-binding GntR family transcriptional regulator